MKRMIDNERTVNSPGKQGYEEDIILRDRGEEMKKALKISDRDAPADDHLTATYLG